MNSLEKYFKRNNINDVNISITNEVVYAIPVMYEYSVKILAKHKRYLRLVDLINENICPTMKELYMDDLIKINIYEIDIEFQNILTKKKLNDNYIDEFGNWISDILCNYIEEEMKILDRNQKIDKILK